MRRHTLRTALISKRAGTGEGSLTLEAALTMPLLMVCLLFFIYLIHAAAAAMTMQAALSQTARQAAAVWYPLAESADALRPEESDASGPDWRDRLKEPQEAAGQLAPYLPEPLSGWAASFAAGNWYPDAMIAKQALEPLVAGRLKRAMLPTSRFRLVKVELPDREDKHQAFLTLEAEYRLPFSFPWSGRALLLTQSVRERVWTGGERLASSTGEEGETGSLSFVSLGPAPVQRGRRVTLTLRTEPGATVDLKVVYKSGPSQARHLGQATADASGQVSWTWLVSGNTTPGEWMWEASGAGSSLAQSFEVIVKGKGG